MFLGHDLIKEEIGGGTVAWANGLTKIAVLCNVRKNGVPITEDIFVVAC